MIYQVKYSKKASKQLSKLPKTLKEHVQKVAAILATNPYPPAAKKLVAHNLFTIRLPHKYRLIYQVRESEILVYIVRIDGRDKVYRELGALEVEGTRQIFLAYQKLAG